MPGDEARAEVVAAARAVADDEIYGPATIEVRDRIGTRVAGQRGCEHNRCVRVRNTAVPGTRGTCPSWIFVRKSPIGITVSCSRSATAAAPTCTHAVR